MLENAEPRILRAEREIAFDTLIGDHNHLTWFDFTHKLGADDIQRTGFGAQRVAFGNLAQNKRTNPQWIAYTDELGPCHGNDGKGPFNTAQRVFHAFWDIFL